MIREELKKLYIKQFGLILTIIFVVGEIIYVNFLYPKREFSSEFTEHCFYEYTEELSGELTPDKERKILAEQERIVDAENERAAIEKRLLNGEYGSEDEFIAEYDNNRLITDRKDAFDLIFAQYSYALESPNNRYLTAGNYSGLGADFPDVLMLALVIFMTAVLFMNEESSGVITFVRISENGRQKTLLGKFVAISVFLVFGQIFRMLLELSVMLIRGNIRELAYPISTIHFFKDCPYDISILEGFLAISALRFLGYIFVAALVIVLCVTVRKALPVIFVPCAICLLQQFAFSPATPAYYIPTGFLRGVGYLRGDVISRNDSGEEVKLFSEIPFYWLLILMVLTILFIMAAVFAARNYYLCKTFKPSYLKSVMFPVMILLWGTLSGCTEHKAESICFNLLESRFFAQNDENFFISNDVKITQISKIDGSELSLVHDAFGEDDLNVFYTPMAFYKGNLCYCSHGDVYKISSSDYTKEVLTDDKYDQNGFLGIAIGDNSFSDIGSVMSVGFFIDDNMKTYDVYNKCVLRDGKHVINEDIYNDMLCFDGKRIYYVNRILQLKCFDIGNGETTRLPGEFVRSVYYDGKRLLYSDKNGIYSFDTVDNSTMKISDKTATQISSDGENIVYQSDNKLYLLGEQNIELYAGNFDTFAIISDTDKLAVVWKDGTYELLDIPT